MQRLIGLLLWLGLASAVLAQDQLPPAVEQKKQEKKEKKELKKQALRSNVEIRGNSAFEKERLLDHLKEQIATIEELGLTPPRADDTAFFLELFYRRQGYHQVQVDYSIQPGNGLILTVNEGPLVTLSEVRFVGAESLPHDKLFDYVVGPTRERFSRFEEAIPFVPADIEEGVELLQRLYVAEGFRDVIIEEPKYNEVEGGARVNTTIVIREGRRYTFGNIRFTGPTVYRDQVLLEEILDLVSQPYTEARVSDIKRRLQAFYKKRGYFNVEIEATGHPELAPGGNVPVRVSLQPGELYYFDGISVTGTEQLRTSYLRDAFRALSGDLYSPEAVELRFRELMRTGLFNLLQINPVPAGDNRLRLDINVEEAKPREIGFTVGYGTFQGYVVGAQYRDLNLFGYGRPVTTSIEYSQRSYEFQVQYEDPYLFGTDYKFLARLSALTFEYDGYTKSDFGGRFDLKRKITRHYEVGLFFLAKYVEVTDVAIKPFVVIGQTRYRVSSIGFVQKYDLRDNPLTKPRGVVFDHTFDVATEAFGSEIDFIRTTARVAYHWSFGRDEKTVPQAEDVDESGLRKWFENSGLAVGARVGVIHPLSGSGPYVIPIDERFFNGGSSSVRSFDERELGPRSRNLLPIGGEFFTVFNAEYTFPIYGELHGAVFFDAGNLLPDASEAGLDDMRYGIGGGLRYQLPVGPIRLDYAVNPDPQLGEDRGAFHFSFGFAF